MFERCLRARNGGLANTHGIDDGYELLQQRLDLRRLALEVLRGNDRSRETISRVLLRIVRLILNGGGLDVHLNGLGFCDLF